MVDSLIVGFGKAGRELHWRCLKRLAKDWQYSGKVGIIDNGIGHISDNLPLYRTFSEAFSFSPENTIVHICTPPARRLEVIHQAVKSGYTKFVVEKPLAFDNREAEAIRMLDNLRKIKLAIVSQWLSFEPVKRLKALIDSGQLGQPLAITVHNDKPRFSRTVQSQSHSSAFDVELPHALALALYLADSPARLLSSQSSTMNALNFIIPHMGAANMSLLHANGLISVVSSNLMSPIRRRMVHVHFARGSALLHLPTTGDDNYSSLTTYDKSGVKISELSCMDDPFSCAMKEYYDYLSGEVSDITSKVEFHCNVVSILSAAKRLNGIISDSDAEGGQEPWRNHRMTAVPAKLIPLKPREYSARVEHQPVLTLEAKEN